jgi:Ca2+-binding EF-hand superfamily protein
MLTLRETNAGSAFDSSDANGDGYLDQEDMRVTGTRLCDRLGLDETSPHREQIHSAFAIAWQNAAAAIDGDGDGRISRDEYIRHAFAPDLDRTTFVAAVVWPITDALWDALDLDGDEHLNLREYLHLWAAYEVDGPAARRAFSMLDVNGDGRLSKDEFAQAIYDFYYSDDPGKAGIPILGSRRSAQL